MFFFVDLYYRRKFYEIEDKILNIDEFWFLIFREKFLIVRLKFSRKRFKSSRKKREEYDF